MKKIFLVRHSHVQVAEEETCYGSQDVPLSELGEHQAHGIADYFKDKSLDAVFASDLSRATYPAELIARQQNLELKLVPQLREINFGDWEGLKYKTIQQEYPEGFQKWLLLDKEFCFPGGESFKIFRDRVLRAFNEIVQNGSLDDNSNIAIITHGGVTRTILLDLLRMPWQAAWQLGQDFAALNIIEYHEDCAILKLLNGSCISCL